MKGLPGSREVIVLMPNRGPGDWSRFQLQRQKKRSVSRDPDRSFGTRGPKGRHGVSGPNPDQHCYGPYCQLCLVWFPSQGARQHHLQTSVEHLFVDPLAVFEEFINGSCPGNSRQV